MCLTKVKSTLDMELANPPQYSFELESLQETVPACTTRKSNIGNGGGPCPNCCSPLHFCLLAHGQRRMKSQYKVEGAEDEGTPTITEE